MEKAREIDDRQSSYAAGVKGSRGLSGVAVAPSEEEAEVPGGVEVGVVGLELDS
jgi:hypothetical protein